MPTQKQIQAAITALKVDVPVMRAERAKDGTITLYLYGGEIKTWKPKSTTKPRAAAGKTNTTPRKPRKSKSTKSRT